MALDLLLEEMARQVADRAEAIVVERLVREDAGGRAPVSPFVTVAEAAELLRCRPQRVHNLLSAGRLSRLKEGGRTLIRRAELEALVVVERPARVALALPPVPRAHSVSGVVG